MTRPMLAARLTRSKGPARPLLFPCLATPKLDGIRCLKVDGQVLSRAFKPIRNRHIVSLISQLPDGVDGELMAGTFDADSTTSPVMRYDGQPDFSYWIFDVYHETLPYEERVKLIPSAPWITPILPVLISSQEEFDAYAAACIAAGHEGVMTRALNSPYKCGRSTPTEQYLVKHKPYEDSEACILGFEEQMHNANAPVLNAFGYIRRPGGRSEHEPKGTLGSLKVRDIHSGVEFDIGTGFNDSLRQRIWDDRPSYVGKIVTYKYQLQGTKVRPRFPVFLRFRDDL